MATAPCLSSTMIVGSLAVCSSNRSDRRRPLSRKRAPLRLDCHHKSEIAADKEEVDGNTIVCHYVQGYDAKIISNAVDGDDVPVPHFGLAMSVPAFHTLAQRIQNAGVKFEIEPHLRFQGQPGEQYTMFFRDPSGNPLEFKAMTNPGNLFAKYVVE